MAVHAEDFRRHLATAIGRPIELRLNTNTQTMLGVTRLPHGLRVSMHRQFLEADEKVLEAVVQFVIKPTPEARAIIREFIIKWTHADPVSITRPPRAIRGTARGRRFNLADRAALINAKFFEGKLQYRIMWGRTVRAGKRQNHVTLGTWNPQQRIIRIHPMLDIPGVPLYFLDFVIYHEMCHIVIPVQVDEQGRLSIHTPEFRALEAQFPQFDRAQAWETRWVRALLTAWNGGKPMPASADDGGPVPPVTPEPTPEPASEPMPEPTREPETPPMKDNLPETPKATKKQYEGPPPDFGEQLSFL